MGISVSQDLLQKDLKGKSSLDGVASDSAVGTDDKVCKDEAADLEEEDRDLLDEKEHTEANQLVYMKKPLMRKILLTKTIPTMHMMRSISTRNMNTSKQKN